jgi:cytochrome c556
MIRSMFAIASAAAIILGVSVAIAQQDVIKQRKDLMKHNGDMAKLAGDMAKGVKPFDIASVHKIFAQFQDAAAKMPDLYPASSKDESGSSAGDKYSPTPKVWEDMADFKSRFQKFAADAKAADASVKDAASLKEALGNIGKNDCGGCHKIYRSEKKG